MDSASSIQDPSKALLNLVINISRSIKGREYLKQMRDYQLINKYLMLPVDD